MSRSIPSGGVSHHARAMFALAILFAVRTLIGLENGWSQESSNYTIHNLTVVSAAGGANSGRFEAVMTFAAATPAGSASFCNTGFGASLGFWSTVGDPPVPNSLFVRMNEEDRTQTVLSWSGSAERFDLYRGKSPATVTDSQNLFATTTNCFAFDSDPMDGPIVYYNLIPAVN